MAGTAYQDVRTEGPAGPYCSFPINDYRTGFEEAAARGRPDPSVVARSLSSLIFDPCSPNVYRMAGGLAYAFENGAGDDRNPAWEQAASVVASALENEMVKEHNQDVRKFFRRVTSNLRTIAAALHERAASPVQGKVAPAFEIPV